MDLGKHVLTLASLGAVAALAYAPTALAGGRFDRGAVIGGSIVGVYPNARAAIAPSFPQPFVPRVRIPGPRRFATFVGPVVYVVPPAFYEPPVYHEPPAVYSPPVETPAPVASPPPPERNVIQYEDGRYELRGDGIATPHRWAWIPNPPPPPKSARDVRLYGWIDEQGALHVTDRWDAVPQQYRAQAKRNQSS